MGWLIDRIKDVERGSIRGEDRNERRNDCRFEIKNRYQRIRPVSVCVIDSSDFVLIEPCGWGPIFCANRYFTSIICRVCVNAPAVRRYRYTPLDRFDASKLTS